MPLARRRCRRRCCRCFTAAAADPRSACPPLPWQAYIPELIECMEREGLRPVPIFINGVEAHTVVSAVALPA